MAQVCPDVKSITISMTRANKILSKLRQGQSAPKPNLCRAYYAQPVQSNCITVSILTFNKEDVTKKIEEKKHEVELSFTKKRLISKWKDKLFALNVHYGIHDILSEMELLNSEKSTLQGLIDEHQSGNYDNLEHVISSMKAVENYDQRYTMNWKVGSFDIENLKSRVLEIEKQLSQLDEKKDRMNIEKSFTIVLTTEEYELLNI